MENVVFSPIPLHELEGKLAQIVEDKIKQVLSESNHKQKIDKEKFATRKEVAERLRISLPTLNTLTKQEIIKGYRFPPSRRVVYKWDEVEAVLQEITSTKYKRKDLS